MIEIGLGSGHLCLQKRRLAATGRAFLFFSGANSACENPSFAFGAFPFSPGRAVVRRKDNGAERHMTSCRLFGGRSTGARWARDE